MILPKFPLGQMTFPLLPPPTFSPLPGAIPQGLDGSDAPPSADTPVLHDFGSSSRSRAELLPLARPLSMCFTGTAPLILTPAQEAGAAVTLVLRKRKLGHGVARKSRGAKCHYSYLRHQAPGPQPLTTTPHCPTATLTSTSSLCAGGLTRASLRVRHPPGYMVHGGGQQRCQVSTGWYVRGEVGVGGALPFFPGGSGILAGRPPRALRC